MHVVAILNKSCVKVGFFFSGGSTLNTVVSGAALNVELDFLYFQNLLCITSFVRNSKVIKKKN